MLYSGVVGACDNAIPELWPECERRWAWQVAERPDSMNIFLKRESRIEDAQYCQYCVATRLGHECCCLVVSCLRVKPVNWVSTKTQPCQANWPPA